MLPGVFKSQISALRVSGPRVLEQTYNGGEKQGKMGTKRKMKIVAITSLPAANRLEHRTLVPMTFIVPTNVVASRAKMKNGLHVMKLILHDMVHLTVASGLFQRARKFKKLSSF